MEILRVEHLTKSYGDVPVIRDLSFSVAEGEFLTILGSSGCGKTTLLRCIDGLEETNDGVILLGEVDVTHLPPNKRAVNTVFQSYALFPHMTVFDNIAYPLRLAHIAKQEIRTRVFEMLRLVQMDGYERRYPSELSGGQRQRIAIARALVAEPKMLLLDEPLGALDFNLRRAMQSELKRLQKSLGMAFLYITHDQEEALNMSDRVAVMKDGKFLEIGTPAEIYDTPSTVYAARFVGEANILPCTVVKDCGETVDVRFSDVTLSVRRGFYEGTLSSGDSVSCALRGEKILLGTETGIPCTVTETAFVGGVQKIVLKPTGHDTTITAARYGLDTGIVSGSQLRITVPEGAPVLCREDTQ